MEIKGVKLNRILKELMQTCGNDNVGNCIIFWESGESIKVSMFLKDAVSFAKFMGTISKLIDDPDRFFTKGEWKKGEWKKL